MLPFPSSSRHWVPLPRFDSSPPKPVAAPSAVRVPILRAAVAGARALLPMKAPTLPKKPHQRPGRLRCPVPLLAGQLHDHRREIRHANGPPGRRNSPCRRRYLHTSHPPRRRYVIPNHRRSDHPTRQCQQCLPGSSHREPTDCRTPSRWSRAHFARRPCARSYSGPAQHQYSSRWGHSQHQWSSQFHQ